jgi:LacI family transcriptional regulator
MERYQGYCQALHEAAITPDPALVLQGEFDAASGRRCAARIFARDRQDWPTAIFAGNDQMAYGILEVAEQWGVRVPEEVAIVGFDDNVLSAYMRPPLTTVRQPFIEMGRRAGEILLTMIEPDHHVATRPQKGGDDPLPTFSQADTIANHPPRMHLPTHLIVRESSGAPHSLTIGPSCSRDRPHP